MNYQRPYLEEVIQAIVAARSALEKPIEERDEQDVTSIDNLCSMLHGFLTFPESIRRELAAKAVLIVIDEKGKELIVHNEELDSFCVLIYGECEQLNETKTLVLRVFNVGDAFGVCEPTTETIRFFGHMVTKCENCAFLCVKRDFYTILTDPANYPIKGTIRHRDENGVCSQSRNQPERATAAGYNSMFAKISGLGHSCVARLKRTFEKLKPKCKNQLETMRTLFDPCHCCCCSVSREN